MATHEMFLVLLQISSHAPRRIPTPTNYCDDEKIFLICLLLCPSTSFFILASLSQVKRDFAARTAIFSHCHCLLVVVTRHQWGSFLALSSSSRIIIVIPSKFILSIWLVRMEHLRYKSSTLCCRTSASVLLTALFSSRLIIVHFQFYSHAYE